MRVLFLLVFLGALDAVVRADESRPNILHILTDDMGGTALSAYGNRVPLIMRWPGEVTEGSECEVSGYAVDFYPTYAELGGASAPADQPFAGGSLLPLLAQGGLLQRTGAGLPTRNSDFDEARRWTEDERS